jgi:hypothetical protein
MDPLSATASVIAILQLSAKVLAYLNDVKCWMWEHRADMNEAEGCCIERAI